MCSDVNVGVRVVYVCGRVGVFGCVSVCVCECMRMCACECVHDRACVRVRALCVCVSTCTWVYLDVCARAP